MNSEYTNCRGWLHTHSLILQDCSVTAIGVAWGERGTAKPGNRRTPLPLAVPEASAPRSLGTTSLPGVAPLPHKSCGTLLFLGRQVFSHLFERLQQQMVVLRRIDITVIEFENGVVV